MVGQFEVGEGRTGVSRGESARLKAAATKAKIEGRALGGVAATSAKPLRDCRGAEGGVRYCVDE